MALFPRTLALACIFALVLPVAEGSAQISVPRVTSVIGTSNTIPVGRTSRLATRPFSIRWRVTATGVQGILRAPVGVIVAGDAGPQLHVVTTQLSVLGNGNVTATFDEQLIVPPEVVERARRLGYSHLSYTRFFQATPGAGPGRGGKAALAFTGGLGGDFEILHIGLSFDDGTPVRVVPEATPLSPAADIEYSGGGVFEAVWEIADGASTTGSPIFRPLRRERRYLGATGRLRLPGPVLPTHLRGMHLVRLRILSPTPFETRVLPRARYVVVGGAPLRGSSASLTLLSPARDTRAQADTRFTWRRVPGAHAYRLEVHRGLVVSSPIQGDPLREPPVRETVLVGPAAEPGPLVSGVLLPADQHEAVLPRNVRARLVPGRAYQWSVRALDAEGRTVAESAPRAILGPADPR